MLQDSDMPSSASALYRNRRQQCLQMQFDKTNISVTKRWAHSEATSHLILAIGVRKKGNERTTRLLLVRNDCGVRALRVNCEKATNFLTWLVYVVARSQSENIFIQLRRYQGKVKNYRSGKTSFNKYSAKNSIRKLDTDLQYYFIDIHTLQIFNKYYKFFLVSPDLT